MDFVVVTTRYTFKVTIYVTITSFAEFYRIQLHMKVTCNEDVIKCPVFAYAGRHFSGAVKHTQLL